MSLKKYKKIICENKIMNLIVIVSAIIFGICYMLTPYFAKNSVEKMNWFLLPIGILSFLVIFVIILFGVFIYREKKQMFQMTKLQQRIFYIMIFIFNILIGVVFLVVYYPGTGNYDTIAIMKNELGMANQHPILYIVFVSILKDIVFFFGGDYEILYVINSIITIILVSWVYIEMIRFLYKKGTPLIVLIIIAVFYTLCPIFNLYKVTFLKDVPFSLLLLMWVPLLYDVWETQGESLKKKSECIKCCMLLCFSLMRGNGIYISIFVLFCMLIVARRMWKRVLILLMILMMTSSGIGKIESYLGVKHLFKETVGIPLQQMAATVYYDGEITDEQKEFMEKVLPLNFIKEKYDPYTSVPLKWGGSPLDNEFLYEHKLDFIKVWAQMLVPNLDIYVKSYLQASYGFWSLGPALGSYRYTSLYEAAYDEWIQKNDINIKNILPGEIQTELERTVNKMIRVPGEGICFWIMVMFILVLMYLDGTKIFLVSAPMVAGVLTVFISTPIAYSWRYILFIPLFIPVLIGLILRKKIKTKK